MCSLNLNYKHVKLLDIAMIERAGKKKYPNGTIYIQVSAARRTGLSQFMILRREEKLESKYAVILPKVKMIPDYFIEALERAAPAWKHRYVGSNINIQMDAFKYFELDYHPDIDTQKWIADNMSKIQDQIDGVERQIEQEKELKRYMLGNMFPE